MFIGEKMKEISTTISYHKNKRSAKFIRSGKHFFYKQHFYKQRQAEVSNPSN